MAHMLAALQERRRAYAKFAWPMLLYGLGGASWLAIAVVYLGRLLERFRLLLANAPPLNTPLCGNAQCDFSMFWPAGLMARAHRFAELYQIQPFELFRQHVLSPGARVLCWIYPPPTLMLITPFSFLPFD
ncbi:MAG TPA: hypothetical protein VEQ16_02095, partial [Acidocella sp.]|nr:hypothetical protein [Acidocella sp.]